MENFTIENMVGHILHRGSLLEVTWLIALKEEKQ